MNQPVSYQVPGRTVSAKPAARPLWKRSPLLTITAICSVLGVLYWSLLASDRYVSETHVIVQKTELGMTQAFDLSGMLNGLGASVGHEDQMLLRDYLTSVDMLRLLDEQLDLRSHYSAGDHDLLSRMWSRDEPIEWFHRYFLDRVSVEYDDYSGVLVILAQAYDPLVAQAITRLMVFSGERFMNELSHRLANEQVTFLEEQVDRLRQRAQDARNSLIRYQNQTELASPQATVESRVALISKLEATRAELQTNRSAMKAYLVKGSPQIEQLDQQIAAIQKQVEQEKQELTSTQQNVALNRALEEYQRLELDAQFAEETYKSALVALEHGRVEASRKLKAVSVLRAPTLPEYPEKPDRIYNSLVFVLFAFVIAGLIHLTMAVVRDHAD